MAQSPSGIPSTNNSVMSITRSGKYEPFNLQVARGQIAGHSVVNLFGYNNNISQTTASATSIAIWENSQAYTFPSSASTMTCSSTSALDVSPAAFVINGLDKNFNPVSEVIVLNGTTGVTTKNSYLRINNLAMTGVASGQTSNVGTITVKQSSNIVAQINPGIGKSQAAIYTVPAGYSFYLEQVSISTDNQYTGSPLYYNVVSTNNNTGVTFDVLQQAFTVLFVIDRSINPFFYPEKSDIQWEIGAPNVSSAVQVGIVVDGKLISNGS